MGYSLYLNIYGVGSWGGRNRRAVAQAATWAREVRPSLARMWLTWVDTVRSESPSNAAI
jgi:hypothetical protein